MHTFPASLYTLILALLLILVGCDQDSGPSTDAPSTTPQTSDVVPTQKSDSDPEPVTGSNRRMAADWDFAQAFPLLSQLIATDEALTKRVEQYARLIMGQADVSNPDKILALLDERDLEIIPRLADYAENIDIEQAEGFEREMNQLGIQLVVAEGRVVGLGSAAVLTDQISQHPSLKAYMDFKVAYADAQSGEYPYLDMSPYERMLLAGEALSAANDPVLYKRIEQDYQDALITFTDIHLVNRPNTRTAPAPVVGGTHTESYPYETELGTHKSFVANHPESQYQRVVKAILQNPSEISERPEQLYVIVTQWLNTETMARQRVSQHLVEGEDIPHFLAIKRPDGETAYAIAYRFFEEEEKALAAFDIAEKRYPTAELVYCSIKGETLYQLGPAAN